MVRCGQCNIDLPIEYEASPRLPCPNCNSDKRFFTLSAGGGNFKVVGGDVRLVHRRPGLQSSAEADDQGRIKLTATGPSPKNEEDSHQICVRLVESLNSRGADWCEPFEGTRDVDWCSTNSAGDSLQMQVVRASNNSELWQKINEEGSATVEWNDSTVAQELFDVVQMKADKYPPAQRKSLVLVIDAARTPSHTFQKVLDVFRDQYLRLSRDCGFAQIWLVGAQKSLVERLDSA